MRVLGVVVLCLCLAVGAGVTKVKVSKASAEKHKPSSLEEDTKTLEDAHSSILPFNKKANAQPEVVMAGSLKEALELIKEKNSKIAELTSKIYGDERNKELTSGAEHFIAAQTDLFETFNSLILPYVTAGSSAEELLFATAPDSIDVYIDGNIKNLCFVDIEGPTSGKCAAKLRDSMSTLVPEAAVPEDCATGGGSGKGLLFIEKEGTPETRAVVCLTFSSNKISASLWAGQIQSSVKYEFLQTDIPQIQPSLLQAYLHAIRKFNAGKLREPSTTGEEVYDVPQYDLVSFLKMWSDNMGSFQESDLFHSFEEENADLIDAHSIEKSMLYANLKKAVQLFVLQEAAHEGRIPWSTVEQYLPQLPAKTKDRDDNGFLLFKPITGQSAKVQRIIKNPRHKFALRAKLSTIFAQ